MTRALLLLALATVGCVGDLGDAGTPPNSDDPPARDGDPGPEAAPAVPIVWNAPPRERPPTWEPVETPWCASEGWLGLDAQTCFYVPAEPQGEVIVYLHGMMPPDASPATQQQIVAEAAEASGAVAIFPQGIAGLCSWDPSVIDWLCWPTSRGNVDMHAAAIIAGFEDAVELLESVLGLDLGRRHALGFSNGGYFASFIGLENLWHTDGAGLVAAGRSYVDTSLLSDHRPPLYIAVGALDGTSVKNSAQNLAYVLELEGWSHELVVHANRGHEIRVDDFAAAFALWNAP